MVTLAHPVPDDVRPPRTAVAPPARRLAASVMLMSVGRRFALVVGGIVAVWTSIALALS